jgi:dihydrofolate reductase
MRPKVILIAALSLDGRIAQRPDQSPLGWVSTEDRAWFREISQKIGVLVVGRKTFATIGRPLKGRRLIVFTSHPQDYPQKSLLEGVEFTNLPPEKLLKQLGEEGVKKVLLAGGSELYSQFFKKRFVDEVWLTFEPAIFGRGIPFIDLKMPMVRLKLLEITKLNQETILLRYKILS